MINKGSLNLKRKSKLEKLTIYGISPCWPNLLLKLLLWKMSVFLHFYEKSGTFYDEIAWQFKRLTIFRENCPHHFDPGIQIVSDYNWFQVFLLLPLSPFVQMEEATASWITMTDDNVRANEVSCVKNAEEEFCIT